MMMTVDKLLLVSALLLTLPLSVACSDSGGSNPGGGDIGPGPQEDTGTPSDEGGADPGGEDACGPGVAGTKPLGTACDAHRECISGHCYDENYLDGFRFCTAVCTFEGCPENGETLTLGGNLANEKGLTQTCVCMPRCKTLADCTALSGAYDTCGNPDPGKKDSRCGSTGQTLTLWETCQIVAACYP